MFLILTARNCGRARRKLLTSTSTKPEMHRLLLLLPFCMNKGRSFIALYKLKQSKNKVKIKKYIKKQLNIAHY